jgi:hypothetical protein
LKNRSVSSGFSSDLGLPSYHGGTYAWAPQAPLTEK